MPRSLQKGSGGAFGRLGDGGRALRSLEELGAVLCMRDNGVGYEMFGYDDGYGSVGSDDDEDSVERENDEDGAMWTRRTTRKYPFAAKYTPTAATRKQRMINNTMTNTTAPSHMSVRMKWGTAQEATSILTALNYFTKKDPNVTLKEVGMCGAGLEFNLTTDKEYGDLLVGASPDSVIQYGDGSVEVLEVKNHCPFYPWDWRAGRRRKGPRREYEDEFLILDQQPLEHAIPPGYVPQLMMEMMCMGDRCQSAIMLRQTATNGAVISRLRRDDAWIAEMLYWLDQFRRRYVLKGIMPADNFFWYDDVQEEDGVSNGKAGGKSKGSKRYRAFVDRTKEISKNAELVDHVEHANIQRVLDDDGTNDCLFLDKQ